MAFGVNPSGFPAPNPGPFPNFIQFREDGVDLGGPDADTVDTGLGVVATRGTGENENVITLTAALEVQALGVPFTDTVTALNIGVGLTATQDVDGVVTITAETPAEFSWRHIDGDGVIVSADVSNGISMDATSGAAVLTLGPDVILPGRSVLVYQKGAASVTFATQSGVNLEYRVGFEAAIAGQYGIVTLLGQDDGSVLLCGDMASAP